MVYCRNAIAFYLLIATLLISSGCHVRYASEPNMPTNYYSIELLSNDFPYLIGLITDSSKYVMVHCSDAVMHIENITVEADKQTIHGALTRVAMEHESYKNGSSITRTYEIKDGQQPFNEVHIHLNEFACSKSDMIAISKTDIKYGSIYTDATRDVKTGKRVNFVAKLTLLTFALIATIALLANPIF